MYKKQAPGTNPIRVTIGDYLSFLSKAGNWYSAKLVGYKDTINGRIVDLEFCDGIQVLSVKELKEKYGYLFVD